MGDIFVGQKILQPKKAISDYFISKGIKFAPAYDSIDDSLKYFRRLGERSILLRSEHHQDYEGSSDLFPSVFLNSKIIQSVNMKEYILSEYARIHYYIDPTHKTYCRLANIDHDKFIEDLSYSAWRYIEGKNRTICADPAIKDKYHIFDRSGTYLQMTGNKINPLTNNGNKIELKETQGMIRLYEEIRDALDPNHCYIVEMQTAQNTNSTYDHFGLQVMRGRDFKAAEFKIPWMDFESIELDGVIGATSPQGEEIILTIKYPNNYRHTPETVLENASIDAHSHRIDPAFSEFMFRKRTLQIQPFWDYDDLGKDFIYHSSINALLKPQCSILTYGRNLERIYAKGEWTADKLIQKKAHFVSDGNKACLRLLE